jgi:hypothetical protein
MGVCNVRHLNGCISLDALESSKAQRIVESCIIPIARAADNREKEDMMKHDPVNRHTTPTESTPSVPTPISTWIPLSLVSVCPI